MRLIDADSLKRRFIKRREEIASARKYGWEWEYNALNAAILLTGCEAVENRIEAEPVKHGRWEWHNEDGWYYSCSVCGHNAYGNTDNIVSGLWGYCPNCGAKMDAEEGAEP